MMASKRSLHNRAVLLGKRNSKRAVSPPPTQIVGVARPERDLSRLLGVIHDGLGHRRRTETMCFIPRSKPPKEPHASLPRAIAATCARRWQCKRVESRMPALTLSLHGANLIAQAAHPAQNVRRSESGLRVSGAADHRAGRAEALPVLAFAAEAQKLAAFAALDGGRVARRRRSCLCVRSKEGLRSRRVP